MAELDVRPKRPSYWWLWLLLALIIIGVILYLMKGNFFNKGTQTTTTDSTQTTTTDSSSTGKETVATTEPDWSSVNFAAPKASDADVTDKDVGVSSTDKYTIYTLGENILFAPDQKTVQSNGQQKLKQVAASLSKRFKGATIGVFGSTDSTGTQGHNKQLGAERANAIKDWLIKNAGIEESKISVHSLGETKPIANNSTSTGRQQNRNVSIVAFPDSASNKQQ